MTAQTIASSHVPVRFEPAPIAQCDARAPFAGGTVTVQPEACTRPDNHHEHEVFVILSGQGRLDGVGEPRFVRSGDICVFEPFAKHQLTNISSSENLTYFTIYWTGAGSYPSPITDVSRVRDEISLLVSRPTPNTPLHLGHLAGPYLAADMLKRAEAMRGNRAVLILGLDDHQSYVELRARRERTSARQLVDRQSLAIIRQFSLFDIAVDRIWGTASSERHQRRLTTAYQELVRQGHIARKRIEVPFCSTCNEFREEGLCSGLCPDCNALTYGDVCESCLMPVFGCSLGNCLCGICGNRTSPAKVDRTVLCLSDYLNLLPSLNAKGNSDPFISGYLERLAAMQRRIEIPVTTECGWGVCIPNASGSERISAWFEGAIATAVSYDEAKCALGALQAAKPIALTFFGKDNLFFYAAFYPLIAHLAQVTDYPRPTLVCNHFLMVDGEKLSSSAGNGLSPESYLENHSSDVLRLVAALARPTDVNQPFRPDELLSTVETIASEVLRPWLCQVDTLIAANDGVAPDTADWTQDDQRVLAEICDVARASRRALSLEFFSTRAAATAFVEMCHIAQRYSQSCQIAVEDGVRSKTSRLTSLALQLLCVRLLAIIAYPIMPKFGRRLWASIGLIGDPVINEYPEFVPGGTKVEPLVGSINLITKRSSFDH
ncbi:class I tRNA ligase family protein [Bradyrhizobium sp. 170]|uniref:class I tRNA ligase family protein n=1 Tax=Bradyrhizobium sp. 170 TaxID=2782641 RepID=UPI001FFE8FF2|nr:class I tRNA ligase family protein [Bradyrhizobium sp. 170]UPK00887.1 class I tRNA ligase family protein [Bradyrhizobium sp. 170]